MQIKSIQEIQNLPWETQTDDCIEACKFFLYSHVENIDQAMELLREIDFYGFAIPRSKNLNQNELRAWFEIEGIEIDRLKFPFNMSWQGNVLVDIA